MEHQAGVAASLGLSGADELMARIAEAARAIAWTSDDTWRRWSAPRVRAGSSRSRPVGPGLRIEGSELSLADDADLQDPTLVLRAAASAARSGAVIERRSLERLAAAASPWIEPWHPDARPLLVELLRTGDSAIPVIEALDRRGVWGCILPEWLHGAFTPAAGSAARFHRRPASAWRRRPPPPSSRRGSPGRTSCWSRRSCTTSARDPAAITPRPASRSRRASVGGWGSRPTTSSRSPGSIEHHLLLRDVASRRDVDDPATAHRVASAVGSIEQLRSLAALTEADGVATGATAWDPWTAQLIAELVDRVAHQLRGWREAPDAATTFPTPDQLARLMSGARRLDVSGRRVDRDDRRSSGRLQPRRRRPGHPRSRRARGIRLFDPGAGARRVPRDRSAPRRDAVASGHGGSRPRARRPARHPGTFERTHPDVRANDTPRARRSHDGGRLRRSSVRRRDRDRRPGSRRHRRPVPDHACARRAGPRHPLGEGADARLPASTTRSTCATAAARSRTPRTRAEIERAILHSLAE